jgi:hypothetical protein
MPSGRTPLAPRRPPAWVIRHVPGRCSSPRSASARSLATVDCQRPIRRSCPAVILAFVLHSPGTLAARLANVVIFNAVKAARADPGHGAPSSSSPAAGGRSWPRSSLAEPDAARSSSWAAPVILARGFALLRRGSWPGGGAMRVLSWPDLRDRPPASRPSHWRHVPALRSPAATARHPLSTTTAPSRLTDVLDTSIHGQSTSSASWRAEAAAYDRGPARLAVRLMEREGSR